MRLLPALALLALATPASADPAGAEEDEWADFDEVEEEESAVASFPLYGFVEALFGARVVENPVQSSDFVSGEARARVALDYSSEGATTKLALDVVADAISEDVSLDLREAHIYVPVADWLSFDAGRQVLTWGTGDFVFLNDLFPKDWVSFFNGRDDAFLKAPANVVKVGLYAGSGGLDLVWTPIFEPDRYIDGARLSFFDPATGNVVGDRSEGIPFEALEPDKALDDGELAGRLYGTVEGYELALYGYLGRTKRPLAADPATGAPTFSRLAVYGGSVRGPVVGLGGILSLEGAFHHSFKDASGDNPAIPNSQLRGLLGYERELVQKLTLGLQYYVEHTLDHDALTATATAPELAPDELRHVFTLRLSAMLMRDNLQLSGFAFASPSDADFYLRLNVSYRWSDAVTTVIGANVMAGADGWTFFGQLHENTNVHARLRFSY